MSTESYYVSRFLKKLRALPGSWWTRIEQKSGIRGTPDIIGCIRCACGHAKFVAIEAKREGGKATALQLETLRQIEEVGGFAQVGFLPKQVQEIIESLKKLQSPGPFANDAQELFERGQE